MPGRAAIGFDVRGLFFSSPNVLKAMGDATYRTFLRFGQYVRKTARHSIRSRPGPSAPGEPPHSHTGLLKAGTLYSFDPAERSVVVGPARLRGRQTYGPVTVPELMEHGYEARPYMAPAFEAGEKKLDEFWRGSVR